MENLRPEKIPYLAIPSEVDLRRKQAGGGRGTYSLVRAPLAPVSLREAPFPSGETKPNPTKSVLFSSSLRIIIDFCEEDLRVGTAQMPDGKTSTKFRRSKEENRLSLNKT